MWSHSPFWQTSPISVASAPVKTGSGSVALCLIRAHLEQTLLWVEVVDIGVVGVVPLLLENSCALVGLIITFLLVIASRERAWSVIVVVQTLADRVWRFG